MNSPVEPFHININNSIWQLFMNIQKRRTYAASIYLLCLFNQETGTFAPPAEEKTVMVLESYLVSYNQDQQIENEVAALRQAINHPSLAHVISEGHLEYHYRIAINFSGCIKLLDFIAFVNPNDQLSLSVFHKITDAVSYLHQNGIAHLNLQADSITIVNPYGENAFPVIECLGYMRKFDQTQGNHPTQVYIPSNHRNYMPPEFQTALQGLVQSLANTEPQAHVVVNGPAVDVFSLGCLFCALILKQYLFNLIQHPNDIVDLATLQTAHNLLKVTLMGHGISIELIQIFFQMIDFQPLARPSSLEVRAAVGNELGL